MAITLGCATLAAGQRTTIPGRPLSVFMGGMQADSNPAVMLAYEQGPGIAPTIVQVVATGQEIPPVGRRCIGAVSPVYNTMWVAFAIDEAAESAMSIANGTISAIGTSAAGLSGLLRRIL